MGRVDPDWDSGSGLGEWIRIGKGDLSFQVGMFFGRLLNNRFRLRLPISLPPGNLVFMRFLHGQQIASQVVSGLFQSFLRRGGWIDAESWYPGGNWIGQGS